jgi:nicotinate-nucleotide adenylyltransferase
LNKLAVGILGGTFDPVHNGHIHLARSVYNALQLQELRLIPCNQPLLRGDASATAQQRLRMVQLAVTDYPGLIADNRELQRGGYSYTIDTLMSVRNEDAKTPLCLIIGMDQFVHFERWRSWRQIPELAHIIVPTRAGYEFTPSPQVAALLRQCQTQDSNLLHTQPNGAVFFLAVTPLAVSGTEIRAGLRQGLDVSAQLPHKVWEYICENKLYR